VFNNVEKVRCNRIEKDKVKFHFILYLNFSQRESPEMSENDDETAKNAPE
jgi:hypothetical protein